MSVKVHEPRRGKWKIPVIIAAAVVAVCLIGTGVVMKDSSGVSIDGGSVKIEVAEGAGSATIANMLKEKGVIKYPLAFRLQAKMGGYDGKYMPGSATIEDGMSYNDILDLLITADRAVTRITIPEGYEVKQIAQKFDEAGIVSWQDFYAALNPEDYDYDFLKGLPQRDGAMEGYLFPATYEIPDGADAHYIIDLMLAAFDSQFTDEYKARAQSLGMTVDQIVTMASIVEREAGDTAEMPKVACVFYNRRNSGMKFQSCATVQYILHERKPVLSIADTKIDSPYNTYLYPDFPIGPICNPGMDSIRAALYPEPTDAYYFVLGKDGSHVFSTTYEDHVAAMNGANPAVSVDGSAIENQDSMKQY